MLDALERDVRWSARARLEAVKWDVGWMLTCKVRLIYRLAAVANSFFYKTPFVGRDYSIDRSRDF